MKLQPLDGVRVGIVETVPDGVYPIEVYLPLTYLPATLVRREEYPIRRYRILVR